MTGGRTTPTLLGELADRVSTASRLADHPIPGPFRGAVNRAAIVAYRLAATEAGSEAEHAAKVAALLDFVAAVEPDHRPFRAALIEAALAAEVDVRSARRVPVYGRRLRGWMDPIASTPPRTPPVAPAAGTAVRSAVPHSVARACEEAEALDDVDAVMLRLLTLTRALRVAAQRGGSREHLLDAYEEAALGLCVRPATTGDDDARYLLLHAWTLLRHRRPVAAALIRARVRWTRKAGAGP